MISQEVLIIGIGQNNKIGVVVQEPYQILT